MTEYEKQLKRHQDFVNALHRDGIDENMRNYERLFLFEPIGHFNKTEKYEVREEELPSLEDIKSLIETPEQMNERIMKQNIKKIELIEDDKKSIISL